MILILSNAFFQSSMDEVIDWLRHFNKPFIRLNGLNDSEIEKIYTNLLQDKIELSGNRTIDLKKIKSVWFYRWGHIAHEGTLCVPAKISHAYESINKNINESRQILAGYFFYKIRKAKWLGHTSTSALNKLAVLEHARNIGLKIPETLVATSKSDILKFKRKHKHIITKPLSELAQVEYENQLYASYTSELRDLDHINEGDLIFPSLIQKRIDKLFEVRSFYIHGKFYSMAIFSQSDEQTSIDFRRYNTKRPNRNVPFQLPEAIETKLSSLLNSLNLNTGSIDLMYSTKKVFVFLEINPVGQYGMTSKPCNYYLEKLIAESL